MRIFKLTPGWYMLAGDSLWRYYEISRGQKDINNVSSSVTAFGGVCLWLEALWGGDTNLKVLIKVNAKQAVPKQKPHQLLDKSSTQDNSLNLFIQSHFSQAPVHFLQLELNH